MPALEAWAQRLLPAALVLVLPLLAAGGAVWRSLEDQAALRVEQVGRDECSDTMQRFGCLRAWLPAGVAVRYLRQPLQLDDAQRAIVDALAQGLQRRLTDQDVPTGIPVFDDALAHLRHLWLGRHPERSTHELPAMREHVEWWLDVGVTDQRERLLRLALAPHFVAADAASEWVVGDFPPAYDHGALAAAHGLVVVANGGPGAVLFRANR